jgi:hypothetical protein
MPILSASSVSYLSLHNILYTLEIHGQFRESRVLINIVQ